MSTSTVRPRSHFLLILFLGFLNALTPFTIDLYLPAFADISRDLATTVPKVSLSVATYFVGFAFGQILYGPLLDRFGRKKPIFAGLSLYLLATVGCMMTSSVEALWIFRFLSALGGASASVGAITMVRDYFDPKDGARVFSMLMLVLSVSPLFAPSIGSWIAESFGWRFIFALLAGFALIDLALVFWGLPVAYEPDRSVHLRLRPILKNFSEILAIPDFRVYAVSGALSFSGLFIYLTGSPAIFIDGFQVSKKMFGIIFGFLAAAMIGGGQINNWLLKRTTSSVIFKKAIVCQVATSILFILVLSVHELSLLPTVAFFFVLLGCTGVAYPNAASLALRSVSKNVGSASALLGFIQMGAGALLSALVGLADIKGTYPTVMVMVFSSILAAAILIRQPKETRSSEPL